MYWVAGFGGALIYVLGFRFRRSVDLCIGTIRIRGSIDFTATELSGFKGGGSGVTGHSFMLIASMFIMFTIQRDTLDVNCQPEIRAAYCRIVF